MKHFFYNIKYQIRKFKKTFSVKYLPERFLKSDEINFHGGCIGCESQRFESKKRCLGCKYFEPNWDLPDLSYDMEQGMKNTESIIKKRKRAHKINSILK